MDFPHIKDTKFPLIDNVNVYKYQNNFDYARWNGKVSFKLLNVLWNSNYADVPYFDSMEKRDEWFDSQDGYVGTLESLFNNTPTNTVKIPIPYNDAYKYNYLVVDMPMQTSENNPINYDDKNVRVKRWFYFIEDMLQFAPSTTELQIAVDFWTTFIHSVDIPYLMLERGHAPMTKTTVEQFLANPITNNEYLLADDFNFGGESIIQTSNYVPVGNGKKYVLFCAPYRQADFDKFGGVSYSGNSTAPTYANEDNRWGYQLQVNNYEWKYGDSDYSDSDIPVNNMIQTGILNGCECFAIEGSKARAFFNDCAKNCVNFIHGIQAMFILDENMFSRTSEFTFREQTIYIADRKINTQNFTFTKNQFGFDSKYENITKLYTFPYSSLEITDDEGNVFSARIENCGNVQMHEEVGLVYPFLNYNVFFSGINGDGTMDYVWKSVQDTDNDKNMWASDFSKFMMNWNVPVYSIYVSAENEYAANNFFNNRARRAGAIKDYRNAVRYANTDYENTKDSFQTNTNNVERTTTKDVNNTAASEATNVSNVAASGQANTNNVAASGETNTGNVKRTTSKNVANTTRDNTMRNHIGARENGRDFNLNTIANNLLDSTTQTAYNRLLNDAAVDILLIQAGVNTNAERTALTSVSNTVSSIVSGGLSGGGPGAAMGAVSGVMNGVSSAIGFCIDAEYAAVQQTALINKVERLAGNKSYGAGGIDEIRDANKTRNTQSMQETNDARYGTDDSIVEYTNETALANQNANKTADDTNASNTQTTNNANATRTQDTNNSNANRTQTTNNANAARSKTAADTNASATQTTETNNANYRRNATVAAEKANLVQKQLEMENQYKNARLQVPVTYGEYGGDFAPDVYQRRGVRFNIRTQPKSAIAQTGDAMLRFGYALHRVWDMSSGFHYGKHFTFWKAEDIWINDGSGVANAATNVIGNILMKGVTVWRNPSEIGMVGIYDNI